MLPEINNDLYANQLRELLDKPLREVIKECKMVYINKCGFNLGHLCVDGNLVRRLRGIEFNSFTKTDSIYYPELKLEGCPMSFIKYVDIDDLEEFDESQKSLKED